MKKIVSLFVLAVAFVSCGEDIQFNSPAVQATKNGAFWKANTMDAFSDADGLTITATVGTDIVTLHTSSAAPGTYVLGESTANKATYESIEGGGSLYETGDGIGSGKIIISPGGTVTGKFDFIAEDEEGNEVNFTNGDFYQVPSRY
ncbi:hypothetical protein FEDK69T_09630 [Flavobacterium enshiense DK69]|uniref:Lipoprotein n=1 Tax=Flavobacterium enshiense DK69 TaxID=1107311 RepID=V6SDF8_9FLAO|nr:DUF6252 family protein [Flavobacterium enshiense]ESU24514.1 hypothetical protein FEDK69T_09630 [Flavobacterium enshiense DK69]KGO93833.1 hypothetical protein Q767_14240 [Flavobacterium enshiense DK69]